MRRENGGMESRGKKFRNSNFGNEKHVNDGKQRQILKLWIIGKDRAWFCSNGYK